MDTTINETRAPLGILSLGGVWIDCPDMRYGELSGSVWSILFRLTLPQGEELIDFLCSLPEVCPEPRCPYFSVATLRKELVSQAYDRGDQEVARRQRDLHPDPDYLDEELFEQIWEEEED